MGASQRRKGATGERELAQILSENLGWVCKRNIGQARDGGDDITVGKFRIEAKRRKGIAVHQWVDQAARACGPNDVPVVACRADGKEWLVVMRLTDALPMIRGELPPMEP
jgi:Holliday junction resolvase